MSDQRSEYIAAINKAGSFDEQREAVQALAAYDQNQVEAVQRDRDLDWANMAVTATLAPAPGHEVERSPMDTGWLGDFEASNDPNSKHAVLAEASMWFEKVSKEVKADPEEFGIQAEGFMRREASKHGLQSQAAYQAGLNFLGSLWRQSASGLPQVQQTVDGHDNPSATPLPQDVFDNFAPAVAPDNMGVVGTETSDRAPLIQQILQGGGGQGQGQAEWPSQHSESADFSNSYGTVPPGSPQDASSGPLEPQEDPEQDYSNPEFGTATASLVDGPSVAINQTMTLDDFRREAASGLNEIQQVVDPHENPAPTPLPQDVMFPWLIGPDAYGNGGGQQQPQEAPAAPFGHESSRKEAGSDEVGVHTRCSERSPKEGDMCKLSAGHDGPHHSLQDWEVWGGGKKEGSRTHAAGGNGHEVGTPAWFDEEARPGTTSPDHAEKDRLFPDGIPLHGDLSPQQQAWLDGPHKNKQASLTRQADMFGGDEGVEHRVPQPDVANTPDTTPDEQGGYAEGQSDARSGERPTFADASTGAPSNVTQYSKGYSDASQPQMTNPDVPHSLSNQASLRFTKAATAQDPEFVKGYSFAAKWRPGQRLVAMGSGKFEEGLFAGLTDYPTHREAWRAAHRRVAAKHPKIAARTAQHDAYTDYLASQGIDVLAPKSAGTSTDLESTGPGSSPSPSGDTFINGPGQTPPLANGGNPATPGGPAPYNGADPVGSPVVPNGPSAPPAREQTVNDLPGGPVDQNRPMDNPTLAAFRKRVAANLAAQKG